MNVEPLRQKLLATARAHLPGDRVPYAFAKRILARVPARSAPDGWAMWARALWRAAAPCVVLTLLLGLGSLLGPHADSASTGLSESEAFAQQFEQTMLAAVNESEETW